MVHQHGFEVGIAVGFPCLVVLVGWISRREFFEPRFDVLNQPFLVVVYVNSRGNVHGTDQNQALLHAAALQDLFNLRGDVHILMLMASIEGEVFGMRFHTESVSQSQGCSLGMHCAVIIPANER